MLLWWYNSSAVVVACSPEADCHIALLWKHLHSHHHLSSLSKSVPSSKNTSWLVVHNPCLAFLISTFRQETSLCGLSMRMCKKMPYFLHLGELGIILLKSKQINTTMNTLWRGYLTINKVKNHRWRTRVTSKTWEGWQRWHQRRGRGQWCRVSPRVLLMMLLLESKSCMSCPRSQLSAPSDPLFTPLLINRPSSQCKQCLSISQTVLRSVHLPFRGYVPT